MESIGYIIVFFLKGTLPWQDIKAANKEEKYRQILSMKMKTSTEKLCEGIPIQFQKYFNYVKGLGFDEGNPYFQRTELQIHTKTVQDALRF